MQTILGSSGILDTKIAKNLGEYIVTDNPSYNPNIGFNLHWEQLQRSK